MALQCSCNPPPTLENQSKIYRWRRVGGGLREDWRMIEGALEVLKMAENSEKRCFTFCVFTPLYWRFRLSRIFQTIENWICYRMVSKILNFTPYGSVFSLFCVLCANIENLSNIDRKSIEHLSNIYRTSIEQLSNIYRTSIEHRSNIYRKSIEHLSNIYRTSIEHLSKIYRKSIEHL